MSFISRLLQALRARAHYLARVLRRIARVERDIELKHADRPSLMCLPDDVLFLIYDLLWHDRESRRYPRRTVHVPDSPTHIWRDRGQAIHALSLSNRRMRALARPVLSRELHLGPSYGVERCLSTLRRLDERDGPMRYVRHLKIGLWFVTEPTIPPELPSIFAEFLQRWSGVRKVTFSIAESPPHHFSAGLQDTGARFPHVRELVLSPGAEWLIAMCPNVTSVSFNDWTFDPISQLPQLLTAASRAPRLRHFGLHASGSVNLILKIRQALPHLRSLTLEGSVSGGLVESCVPVLQTFPHLEQLVLSNSFYWGGTPGWRQAWDDRNSFRYHALRGASIDGRTPVITPRHVRQLRALNDLPHGELGAAQIGLTKEEYRGMYMLFEKLPRVTHLSLGDNVRAWADRKNPRCIRVRWEISLPWRPCPELAGEEICSAADGSVNEEATLTETERDEVLSTHTLEQSGADLDAELFSLEEEMRRDGERPSGPVLDS